jgi:hypothetical protein
MDKGGVPMVKFCHAGVSPWLYISTGVKQKRNNKTLIANGCIDNEE